MFSILPSPPSTHQATHRVLVECAASTFGLHHHGNDRMHGMIACSYRRTLLLQGFVAYMQFKFVYSFRSNTIAKPILAPSCSGSHPSTMSHVNLLVCGLWNPIGTIGDSGKYLSCILKLLCVVRTSFQFMARTLFHMTYILPRHFTCFAHIT